MKYIGLIVVSLAVTLLLAISIGYALSIFSLPQLVIIVVAALVVIVVQLS